ncbi:MAG: glycogen synthase GlgA [Deltaproteobacteria bacterium]|nr:glycogen synthase GlgA [Deltaproteobacteria bacterium]MBI3388949.1 glycogen synthase GlgA [Deltaproteobacteria bacterium]
MRVLMAASEAVPLAKTGGLADVIGALPAVLTTLGVEVSVVLPAYRAIDRDKFPLRPTGWSVSVPISSRTIETAVLTTELPSGVQVYLPGADAYFDRDELYGTPAGDFSDNAERFAFFARAVLAIAERLGPPQILHCHDWQTALVPAFLRADAARYPTLAAVKTVLTIHNLAYQGVFWGEDWHLLNLDRRYFNPEQIEFYNQINYLKGGIVFADAVTTVSRTYAEEIQTPAFGHRLDGVLRARHAVLTGILNGVDYDEWNPATDPHIAARYSAGSFAGKARCKADLQSVFGLPVDAKLPLFGIVSRLADQKGFDLLAATLPRLLAQPVQLVVLGTGDVRYQAVLSELADRFADRVAVRFTFDNALAHKIEAGADFFLMPSRYEPCGLNQIYSLRYGTIPIVHATGGLQDTITQFDGEQGNGFKFREYTPAALLDCINSALVYYRRPAKWRLVRRNAMAADFSWQRSAQQYVELYERLVA